MFCTYFCFVATNIHIASIVIPGWNTMAPPQLAADAPVLNVTHPTEIHVLVLLGYKLNKAVFYGSNRRLGEWLRDRKSTRLNSSHVRISYAVFCLKKKKHIKTQQA